MFAGGFQNLAFQTIAANNNYPANAGEKTKRFVLPYQLIRENEQIKLINNLKEKEKKVAEEISKISAAVSERKEVETLNKQLGKENRNLKNLLISLEFERAQLIRRIKDEEALLLVLLATRRRRLRA